MLPLNIDANYEIFSVALEILGPVNPSLLSTLELSGSARSFRR